MNRRQWGLSILGLSLTSYIRYSHAAWQSDMIALSGHRFQYNGQRYELADISSPEQDDLLERAREFSDQSTAHLQAILDSHQLIMEKLSPNHRWSFERVRARLMEKDEPLLAEKLIQAGSVRVMPQSEDHGTISRFLALEQVARGEKQGLWALPWYRIRNANELSDARDSAGAYHLFSGVVRKVGRFKGRWFLNLGENYREDVTATIESRLARTWQKSGLNLEALSEKTIRIRGFVEWINGPSIALTHPLALEVL